MKIKYRIIPMNYIGGILYRVECKSSWFSGWFFCGEFRSLMEAERFIAQSKEQDLDFAAIKSRLKRKEY